MERSHETRIIAYSRVVSLSHVIHPRIPLWPGDPPVEFSEVADLDKDGYFLRRFSMGEHSGTHMNAPIAFHRDGPGIDEHPAEALVVPAIVVDIRAQAAADPDHTLSWEDILRWENRHGKSPPIASCCYTPAGRRDGRTRSPTSIRTPRETFIFRGSAAQRRRCCWNSGK